MRVAPGQRGGVCWRLAEVISSRFFFSRAAPAPRFRRPAASLTPTVNSSFTFPLAVVVQSCYNQQVWFPLESKRSYAALRVSVQ